MRGAEGGREREGVVRGEDAVLPPHRQGLPPASGGLCGPPPSSPPPKEYISALADAASLYFYSPSIELLLLDSSSPALTCIFGRGCLSTEFLCPFIKL